MMNKLYLTLFLFVSFFPSLLAGDWRMWGGDPSRNLVNESEKNLPTEWNIQNNKNVKWKATLGSQSYAGPVISQGKIFVGTNNESLKDPVIQEDRGILMCFKEEDGSFLWQAIHDKLKAGRVNDWPYQGVCSTPVVEGNRLYYVSNRCEVVCLDTEGLYDGKNDGPIQNEPHLGKEKADFIWTFDMMEELGVFPHNLATSSPLLYKNLVLLVTSHGVDEGHLNIPNPWAPSFIALHKETGELVWENNTPSEFVLHGQWSSPSLGIFGGEEMAIFPGGDGWIYALNPETGNLIWKFDCNPKESKWQLGGYGTRNNIIATPVSLNEHVYVGVGQDPEHGEGNGHLWKISGLGKGDVTSTNATWHLGDEQFGRTMSTVSIVDGLCYAADLGGRFFCLEEKSGKILWQHDLESAVWGSSLVVDGKVYIGDEDGDIHIFHHAPTKKIFPTQNMGNSVYSTPVAANGKLYIMTKFELYCLTNS